MDENNHGGQTMATPHDAHPAPSQIVRENCQALIDRERAGRIEHGDDMDRTDIPVDAWLAELISESLDSANYGRKLQHTLPKLVAAAKRLEGIGFYWQGDQWLVGATPLAGDATDDMVQAAGKFAHDNDLPAKEFYRGLWRVMEAAKPVAPAPREIDWIVACNEVAGPDVAEEVTDRAYSIAMMPRPADGLAAFDAAVHAAPAAAQEFVCTGDELRCHDGHGCECAMRGLKPAAAPALYGVPDENGGVKLGKGWAFSKGPDRTLGTTQPLFTSPPAAPGIDRSSLLDIVAWWNAYTGPADEALGEVVRRIRSLIDTSPKGGTHPDDAAVDAFSSAMKAKLAEARAKGRGGWNGDEPGMQQRLSDMLRDHVEKGDPRDVANFCMFLHQRGERISVPAPMPRPMDTAPRDGTVVRLLVQFEEHLIEDTDEPSWTIGACNDDLVPEDERTGWQVAGWCWEHDHFTEGKGRPVGWLPMLDNPKGGSDVLSWALLSAGEVIRRGDQILNDDCATWGELAGWEVGLPYNPALHVPMRRSQATSAEAQAGDGGGQR